MRARLSSVGIASVYGGAHSNHTTEMALVSFPDGSYLELMALQPNADPALAAHHEWAKFLKGDAGPCAWAVRTPDLAAETAQLQAVGVTAGAPVRGGRQRPDGTRLEWETADVGPEPRGSFFPFLIHDLTPRQQRVFPQGKPVTRDFKGIARVVIAVRDLDSAAAWYSQAFGLPQAIQQADKEFGAQLAIVGSAPVVLAQPLTAGSWLSQRLDRFGEGPCAIILPAAHAGRYKAASQSLWFGTQISWLNPGKLGWRLGFESR